MTQIPKANCGVASKLGPPVPTDLSLSGTKSVGGVTLNHPVDVQSVSHREEEKGTTFIRVYLRNAERKLFLLQRYRWLGYTSCYFTVSFSNIWSF